MLQLCAKKDVEGGLLALHNKTAEALNQAQRNFDQLQELLLSLLTGLKDDMSREVTQCELKLMVELTQQVTVDVKRQLNIVVTDLKGQLRKELYAQLMQEPQGAVLEELRETLCAD